MCCWAEDETGWKKERTRDERRIGEGGNEGPETVLLKKTKRCDKKQELMTEASRSLTTAQQEVEVMRLRSRHARQGSSAGRKQRLFEK